MWHIPPPNSSPSIAVSAIFCPVTFSSAELMRSVSLELYIILSTVGVVFDGFRAFQTAFNALQDEPNQLFVVKKSKSVDAVNKKLYNSVIFLYLTILNNFLPRRHAHQSVQSQYRTLFKLSK